MIWIIGRRGWVLPWLTLALVLSGNAVQARRHLDQRQVDARGLERCAQGQVSGLSDAPGWVRVLPGHGLETCAATACAALPSWAGDGRSGPRAQRGVCDTPDPVQRVERASPPTGGSSAVVPIRATLLPGGFPPAQGSLRTTAIGSIGSIGAWEPPLQLSRDTGVHVATWLAALTVVLVLGTVLATMRRTVRRQRAEIARREEAERRARAAAAEARGLSAQLSAAHSAAQRLATSLDPEYVLEFFLGTAGEVLGADTASLYTFEADGALAGRSRLFLSDSVPDAERRKAEDIRQVRAPAAQIPQVALTAATGEVQIMEDSSGLRGGPDAPIPDRDAATAWLTVPLRVGGSLVGVALWEVFGGPHRFDAKNVAFAEALGAQAAAALRTAELYASLQTASARATWEATRFGAVIDQMTDGVVITDAQGSVERSNGAAGELFGAGPASGQVREWVEQLDLKDAFHRRLPVDDFPIVRALDGESIHRFELVASSPGREDRHLSVSAIPILSESGEKSGAAMVVRDNTDEQQYAEMLRHTNYELRTHTALLQETNEQLRAATAAKDQFLAMVSHELRTPVNAIMGYAELLDLEIKGSLNEEQKEMLRRLRTTAWHLLGLIDEILDLPKVAAGEIELRLEPVDLEGVLDSAVRQVHPMADAKGLGLVVSHGSRNGNGAIVALADPIRLTQIVVNLLSNAVKFTETGEVQIRSDRNGRGFVEVRVKDTGPGISEAQQERIFEEFYQVEGGLTRRVGGTGLGLAIARRFVRLMGGDVEVESRPGSGSEFILKVPAAPAE